MHRRLKIVRYFENSNKFTDLEIINILAQYMKNNIYIFIFAGIAQSFIHTSDEKKLCSSQGNIFVTVVQIGAGFMGFLNLSVFSRLKLLQIGDFIVLYIINIVSFLLLISFVFYKNISQNTECNSIVVFQKALLYVCLKKEFEITFLLFTRSSWWMRQINACTNCALVVVVFTSIKQETCNPQAIATNNSVSMMNMATLVSYTIVNILIRKKDYITQMKSLRVPSFMIICCFIYIYIKVLISQFTGAAHFSPDCIPIVYALDAYVYIIPIDVIGMIIMYIVIQKEYTKYNLLQQNESDSFINVNNQTQLGIQQMVQLRQHDKDEEF